MEFLFTLISHEAARYFLRDGRHRGRLLHEIYPHTKPFPDLNLSYTRVQREL
jgi:hypothetical protein